MTKKAILITIIIPIIFTWGIDYITKIFATGLQGTKIYGPIGLHYLQNPGIMLGWFKELPLILRVVTLSTTGAFLIFIFSVTQYLISKPLPVLRMGMSILLGGILGNVTDRIMNGYVIDFIYFDFGFFKTPAFNFSDAIQWVGYSMIFFSIFKNGNEIWPDINLRKTFWVNSKFQLSYCKKMIMLGLCFSIVTGTYSYTFLSVILDKLSGGNPEIQRRYLYPFLMSFIFVILIFLFALLIISVLFSHRIAGPIYAFERFITELLAGKDTTLKLREGDQFTHLEELSVKLKNKVNENIDPQTNKPKDTCDN